MIEELFQATATYMTESIYVQLTSKLWDQHFAYISTSKATPESGVV